MEVGYLACIAILMFLAKSDAAVTFTTPAAGTPAACPTLGTMAEGTTSGAVVTAAATADNGALVLSLEATTDTKFDLDAGTQIVSVAAAATSTTFDYEDATSVSVIIVGTDDDATPVSVTCTIAITNLPTEFTKYTKTLVLPSTTASGDTITTIICPDGTMALDSGDDTTSKFTFTAGTGVLTKSANVFDTATKAYYSLVFTCTEGTVTATATVGICLDSESNCPSQSKAPINTGILAGLTVPTLLAMYSLI